MKENIQFTWQKRPIIISVLAARHFLSISPQQNLLMKEKVIFNFFFPTQMIPHVSAHWVVKHKMCSVMFFQWRQATNSVFSTTVIPGLILPYIKKNDSNDSCAMSYTCIASYSTHTIQHHYHRSDLGQPYEYHKEQKAFFFSWFVFGLVKFHFRLFCWYQHDIHRVGEIRLELSLSH